MSSFAVKQSRSNCVFPRRRTTLPKADIDIHNKIIIATLKSRSAKNARITVVKNSEMKQED